MTSGAVAQPDLSRPGSFQTGLAMAQLSKLAYGPDMGQVESDLLGAGYLTYDFVEGKAEHADTQAVIVSTRSAVVVAFRGTEPKKLQDLLTDVKFRQVDLPSEEGRGAVHRGFHDAFTPVWDKVRGVLAKHGGKKVFITGHSLGGALAVVLAARLVASGQDVEGLHTFGQPRVGDPTFARWLAQNVHHFYRWRNNNDIVTRMPPGHWGYEHSGHQRYFNRRGNLKQYGGLMLRLDLLLGRYDNLLKMFNKLRATDGFGDHSMDNGYVPLLDKISKGA